MTTLSGTLNIKLRTAAAPRSAEVSKISTKIWTSLQMTTMASIATIIVVIMMVIAPSIAAGTFAEKLTKMATRKRLCVAASRIMR